MIFQIDKRRIQVIRDGNLGSGPVVYWMSRDQRSKENWALLYAQSIAKQHRRPMLVLFCLTPTYLGASYRQYEFMVGGLKEVEASLAKKNIPFILLTGNPSTEVPNFIKKHNISLLVTDFNPLRIKRSWDKKIGSKISIPFHLVDAHNIIPCWEASQKLEYAAYTLRPKIKKLLHEFLVPFPPLKKHPYIWDSSQVRGNWKAYQKSIKASKKVPPVTWIKPGELPARKTLNNFITKTLDSYGKLRNDPNSGAQSDLSPYLHFGQISAQRCALEALSSTANAKDEFLEELIVRRELADNFCYYNPSYDKLEGFPGWSKKTLTKHRKDHREYIYSLRVLENAKTHDNLWNAAQREMMLRGKMHGYMRMYWAKKILEWVKSPEEALEISIYLNDKYELDGRDPNGYVGIAWSIGGVHDRAWPERPIFGKIRYMSYNGSKSKFNIKAYINRINNEWESSSY